MSDLMDREVAKVGKSLARYRDEGVLKPLKQQQEDMRSKRSDRRMQLAMILVTGIALAVFILLALGSAPLPKNAGAAAPAFDHSNCQYPYRWSNPVDGCDNSDPAAPECIKFASTQEDEAECIAGIVEKYKQAEQPAAPVEVIAPVEQPTPAPVTCGGK